MSLRGTFKPPGDKSISHRLALMSLLAEGRMELTNFSPCADVGSSLEAVETLGVRVGREGEKVVITGAGGEIAPRAEIDCGNSGTTMRLLMGLLAGRAGRYVLDGDESLRRRPMERVAEPLRRMGAQVACREGKAPVEIEGRALTGLDCRLPVASAQLKSALLLAGLQAEGRTRVREPNPSRDHTERLVRLFGGRIETEAGAIAVERSKLRLPESFAVPGDASSAAFFLTAAALVPGSEVTAEGVLLNPTRIGFLAVLRRLGVEVEVEVQGETPEPWGRIRVRHTPGLRGGRIEAEEVPLLVDEVPILALAASQAEGETVFEGVAELRLKESDRLAAIAGQLGRLGARITTETDRLVIQGPTPLTVPAGLDSLGDHRIAMTLRLALLLAGGECPIEGEDCAAVSYPGFHEELRRLSR